MLLHRSKTELILTTKAVQVVWVDALTLRQHVCSGAGKGCFMFLYFMYC